MRGRPKFSGSCQVNGIFSPVYSFSFVTVFILFFCSLLLFFFKSCFWITSSSAQGLLLVLCSGVTESVEGWCCQGLNPGCARQMPYLLCISPVPFLLYPFLFHQGFFFFFPRLWTTPRWYLGLSPGSVLLVVLGEPHVETEPGLTGCRQAPYPL